MANRTLAERIYEAKHTGKNPPDLDDVTITGGPNMTNAEKILYAVNAGRLPPEVVQTGFNNQTIAELIDGIVYTGDDTGPDGSAGSVGDIITETGYEMTAHTFYGTGDLVRVDSLAGVTEDGTITGSMWLNLPDINFQDGLAIWVADALDTYVNYMIPIALPNRLRIFIGDDSFNGIEITTDEFPTGTLAHLLFTAHTDFAMGNKIVKVYINGVSALEGVFDFVGSVTSSWNGNDMLLGDDGFVEGANPMQGDVGDFWFAPGQLLDIDDPLVRAMFIDGDGNPVYLGANGELPSGVSPAIFYSSNNQDGTLFTTNRGTGGSTDNNHHVVPYRFDGVDDRIDFANVSGITDNGKFIMSFMIFPDFDSPVEGDYIFAHDTVNGNILMYLQPFNGEIKFECYDATLTKTFAVTFDNVYDSAFHHVVMSVDTAQAAGNKIAQVYVDGQERVPTVVDADSSFSMPLNNKNVRIGAHPDLSTKFAGYLGDFYYAPGQFIDLTDPANLAKFIDTQIRPVDLGADGTAPTGTAPAIFLSDREDDGTTFNVNRGTGGPVA